MITAKQAKEISDYNGSNIIKEIKTLKGTIEECQKNIVKLEKLLEVEQALYRCALKGGNEYKITASNDIADFIHERLSRESFWITVSQGEGTVQRTLCISW